MGLGCVLTSLGIEFNLKTQTEQDGKFKTTDSEREESWGTGLEESIALRVVSGLKNG